MPAQEANSVFAGPGEVRRIARSLDWSTTPLGPVTSWSPVLRGVVRTMLGSGFPMAIVWGAEYAAIYNDAFVPVQGAKHPAAFGAAVERTWPENWDQLKPRMDQVMVEGLTLRFDDERQILQRNGYPEECYFTFAQSPITETDGRIAGVLTVSSETTGKMLNERRMRMVRELGALSAAEAGSTTDTCLAALRVLEKTRESIPFAAAFLRNDAAQRIDLVATYGLAPDASAAGVPLLAEDPAGIVDRVLTSGRSEEVHGLRASAPGAVLAGPLGPLTPDAAVVMPLTVSGRSGPIGALVLGVNPYRPLDTDYREFLELVGRQFRVALTDSVAYEQERRRVQVLADLDRTKTEFFQNVSHELRTPLTLLLAPLQDLLAAPTPTAVGREDLEAAVRAAERLRRMVDALLDFSGAQAPAVQPGRDPIDLAGATRDVAGMFRSVAERAGLLFGATVPPGPVTASVDRSMWSTIVTNLLSNALKYPRRGRVALMLATTPTAATLTVSDTGIGIASEELTRVFERSYRSAGVDAEGAGLGLAIVADLVRALSGTVEVTSELGAGSTFTVTVPLDVVPSSTPGHGPQGPPPTDGLPRILVVEDDADLRKYLTRLLIGDGWTVEAVADAETGMAAVAQVDAPPFDLVLTDLMLPGRNGLELVAHLRSSPRTERLPVLILTARGGVDAAAEGLAAGADDYITKPFASRDLLARVRSNHELHVLRERSVDRAQDQARNIRNAVDSDRQIGTAVGMLMANYQLTAKQAFALLVRSSRHTNSTLQEVAAVVVHTGALPFRRSMVDDQLSKVAKTP